MEQHYWTGITATAEALDLVLLSSDGGQLDQVRVPNDVRAVFRVIKHWARQHRFDPTRAVFCAEDRTAWAGAVLEELIGRTWDVRVFLADALSDDVEGEGTQHPASLLRSAIGGHVRLEPLSLIRLRTWKVDRLRERRDELVSIRSRLEADGVRRNHQFEVELRREFERMDRRHVQLIDKLLSRLDALIRARVSGAD